MTAFRTLIAMSVATLATACASTGDMNAAPALPVAANASAPSPMATMEPRMKAMQEMHQKMLNAKTPAERQALMADHMTAMQGGMAMMKEMHAMHGMGATGGKAPMPGMGGMAGMGGTGGTGGMADGKGMPADMAARHQMMTDHMAMMQMMMDMMVDRMPPASGTQ
jgi:hypothetical protein